jgi:hypothetical protein
MKSINRRSFLAGGTVAGVLTGLDFSAALRGSEPQISTAGEVEDAVIDFRYAPADFQSTICFPDDPDKTVIGKRGDLRYDFPADIFASIGQFGTVVEFGLAGMGQDSWRERTLMSRHTGMSGISSNGMYLRYQNQRIECRLNLYVVSRQCPDPAFVEPARHSLHRGRRDMQTRSFIGVDIQKATRKCPKRLWTQLLSSNISRKTDGR